MIGHLYKIHFYKNNRIAWVTDLGITFADNPRTIFKDRFHSRYRDSEYTRRTVLCQ